MSKGHRLIVYLSTEDKRKAEAIAEAVADTLDIAAGRPRTPDDDLPWLLTLGEAEIPDDPDVFAKQAMEHSEVIIVPKAVLDDEDGE